MKIRGKHTVLIAAEKKKKKGPRTWGKNALAVKEKQVDVIRTWEKIAKGLRRNCLKTQPYRDEQTRNQKIRKRGIREEKPIGTTTGRAGKTGRGGEHRSILSS